jgi:hypothetical protein
MTTPFALGYQRLLPRTATFKPEPSSNTTLRAASDLRNPVEQERQRK